MPKKRKQKLQKCIINGQFDTKMQFIPPTELPMTSQGLPAFILSKVFSLFSFSRATIAGTAKTISKSKNWDVQNSSDSQTLIYFHYWLTCCNKNFAKEENFCPLKGA
jgi:hypothetical protein